MISFIAHSLLSVPVEEFENMSSFDKVTLLLQCYGGLHLHFGSYT